MNDGSGSGRYLANLFFTLMVTSLFLRELSRWGTDEHETAGVR